MFPGGAGYFMKYVMDGYLLNIIRYWLRFEIILRLSIIKRMSIIDTRVQGSYIQCWL